MPKSGCPKAEFPWHEGTIYQDTEDHDTSNACSKPCNLAGGMLKNGDTEQKFCMKTQFRGSKYSLPWPKGQYCIFKKGECPEGKRLL